MALPVVVIASRQTQPSSKCSKAASIGPYIFSLVILMVVLGSESLCPNHCQNEDVLVVSGDACC